MKSPRTNTSARNSPHPNYGSFWRTPLKPAKGKVNQLHPWTTTTPPSNLKTPRSLSDEKGKQRLYQHVDFESPKNLSSLDETELANLSSKQSSDNPFAFSRETQRAALVFRSRQIAKEILETEEFQEFSEHYTNGFSQNEGIDRLRNDAFKLYFKSEVLDPEQKKNQRVIVTRNNEREKFDLEWKPVPSKNNKLSSEARDLENKRTLLLLKLYISEEFGPSIADELWQPGSDLFSMYYCGASLTRGKLLQILKKAKESDLDSRFVLKRWASEQPIYPSDLLPPLIPTSSRELNRFTGLRHRITITNRRKRFVWKPITSPLLKEDPETVRKFENKTAILAFMSYLEKKEIDLSICNYIWKHHFEANFISGRQPLTYAKIDAIYKEAKAINKLKSFELSAAEAKEEVAACFSHWSAKDKEGSGSDDQHFAEAVPSVDIKKSKPIRPISHDSIRRKQLLNSLGFTSAVGIPNNGDDIEVNRAFLRDLLSYIAERYGEDSAHSAWESRFEAFYLVGTRPSSKEFLSIITDCKTRFHAAKMEINDYIARHLRDTEVILKDRFLDSQHLKQLRHTVRKLALSELRKTGTPLSLRELDDLVLSCHARICSKATRRVQSRSLYDDYYDALKSGRSKLVWHYDKKNPDRAPQILIEPKSEKEIKASQELRYWIRQTNVNEFISGKKRKDRRPHQSKKVEADAIGAGSEFLFYTSSVSYITPFVPKIATYTGVLPSYLRDSLNAIGFSHWFDPKSNDMPFLADLFAQTREPYLAASGSAFLAVIVDIYNYQDAKTHQNSQEDRVRLLATEYRIDTNLITLCKYFLENPEARPTPNMSDTTLNYQIRLLENQLHSKYAELTAELGGNIDETNLILGPKSAALNGAYAANSALYVAATEIPLGEGIQSLELLVSSFGYGAVTFLLGLLYGYMIAYEHHQEQKSIAAKKCAQFAIDQLDKKALYRQMDVSFKDIQVQNTAVIDSSSPTNTAQLRQSSIDKIIDQEISQLKKIPENDPLNYAHRLYRQHKRKTRNNGTYKKPNAYITESVRGDVAKSIYRSQNDSIHSFNKWMYVIKTVSSFISSAVACFLFAVKVGLVAAAISVTVTAVSLTLTTTLVSMGFGLLVGLIIFLLIIWYRHHTTKALEDEQNAWLNACRYMEGAKWKDMMDAGIKPEIAREFAFRKYLRRNSKLSLAHLAFGLQHEYKKSKGDQNQKRRQGIRLNYTPTASKLTDVPMPVTDMLAEYFRPHYEENLNDEEKLLENLKWRNTINSLGSLEDINDVIKNLQAMLIPF